MDSTKTKRIFAFLKLNSSWNDAFQKKEYLRTLAHCQSDSERLRHLLFATVYTQAKPKMTELAAFWRGVHGFEASKGPSLVQFTESLEKRFEPKTLGIGPWERLFWALNATPGWGPKTSALFVKAAIRLHQGQREFHFWHDSNVTKTALNTDRIHLPVDAVITDIFRRMGLARANFRSINEHLSSNYSATEMLVWDDLWYWGFFNQIGSGAQRTLGWNPDKFWSQISAPKSDENQIKQLSEQFIRLIG